MPAGTFVNDALVPVIGTVAIGAPPGDVLHWTGRYQTATPNTIRQRLLHIAGRVTPTGQALHLDTDWPWTPTLLTALDRIPPTVNPTT